MKFVLTVDVHCPNGKPEPWAFTVRVQEYRQGRHYGGAASKKVTMTQRASYESTMRCARKELKEMIAWALT